MQPGPSVRASRARVVLTVLVTLFIVVAEFALLTGVYVRGHPVRSQLIAVSSVAGEVRTATSPVSADVRHDVSAALDRAADAGLSGTGITRARAAVSALNAEPASAVALQTLRTALGSLDTQLSNEQSSIDLQAELIYVALLISVSLGWMVWFRRLVARHRDLQHQLTEQDARAAGERRLGALVRSSTDIVAVCDLAGRISFVTPSVQAVLGVDPASVPGRCLVDFVEPADRDAFLRLLGGAGRGTDELVATRMRHAAGRLLDVEGTVANLLTDPDIGGLVVTIRDVTARATLERELSHQAFHDALTGLPNRELFTNRLAHALDQRGTGRPLVVLYLDLDEFKNINDRLGHGSGDQVLIEVADRARAAARRGDTVARLGGDEFAVLIQDIDLAEARELAERLQDVLGQPMTIDGHTLSLAASIGLVGAEPGAMSGEEALRNADVAMYLAKDRGRGIVAVYEPRLHEEALDRLALSADLQHAIAEGGLLLHYQPTIDLVTGEVAGFEALVRWLHPTRGMLGPLVFIPLAEQTGLIQGLGSWVLRTACAAAVELGAAVPPDSRRPSMAVNVTAQQLGRPDFVAEVLEVLAGTGLDPHRLTIEITESVLMQDVTAVIARLATLRELGIRIAIDDFGTGYSSLAYLRTLPLDVLKVDKAFIDRVATDKHDAALTGAILAMSAAMTLATVAEGVEDVDQAAWLTAARCTYGQGYYWSRPVPLAEARELLRTFGAAAVHRPRAVTSARSL